MQLSPGKATLHTPHCSHITFNRFSPWSASVYSSLPHCSKKRKMKPFRALGRQRHGESNLHTALAELTPAAFPGWALRAGMGWERPVDGIGRMSGAAELAQVLVLLCTSQGWMLRVRSSPSCATDADLAGQCKWQHQVCHWGANAVAENPGGHVSPTTPSLPFSHAVKLPRCLAVIFWLFPVPMNHSMWHAGSLAAGQFFQLFWKLLRAIYYQLRFLITSE